MDSGDTNCLWDKAALEAALNDPEDNTRTMRVLADILAADLYRRTTGIRQSGAQSALADLAAKRAFDLLEACRQSGYRLMLRPKQS